MVEQQDSWQHLIAREKMKYVRGGRPEEDKILAICRAIENECGAITIKLIVRANGTSQFSVTGSDEGAVVALQLIHERLVGRPNLEPPPAVPNVPGLSAENLQRHNEALAVQRQFVCGPCTNVWWRRVFQYKPVSCCQRCNVRYDPIPRDLEFGWGRYRCPNCHNTFAGRARPNVRAQCYKCGHMVIPEKVGPREGDGRGRGKGNRHSCEACNNGQIRPCPSFNQLPVVSIPHVSTGSTVTTFLTQQSVVDFEDD